MSTAKAAATAAAAATTATGRLFIPASHRAQPVSVAEFADALRATTPRFPHDHGRPRRVGLAVSGGVDSMALAYLCAGLRATSLMDVIFDALTVDHGLREGSAQEAAQVARVTAGMGHRSVVLTLPRGAMSSQSQRIETDARRLRYRALATHLVDKRAMALLLAHHADDQHETLLMRLLSGHGLHGGHRALRGMRPAGDVPECVGIYGAHRSGLWDLASMSMSMSTSHDIPPIHTEDLGIVAYRPLLAFGKDRLEATCVANGVPWFEDATNADASLTVRNALRTLIRRHALPLALQKPAVLELAARCEAKAQRHEHDARRWMAMHSVVRAFSPHVGTLNIRLPRLRIRPRPDATDKRRARLRDMASAVVRLAIDAVAPEPIAMSGSQLQRAVDQLFPDLARSDSKHFANGFTTAGVQFVPVASGQWRLSRAPFTAAGRARIQTDSEAHRTSPRVVFAGADTNADCDSDCPWTGWALWDGRMWVRVRSRLPVTVQPYTPDDAHAFFCALGPAAGHARRLLATHAPGKVRYTLPGLYAYAAGDRVSPGHAPTLLALPTVGLQVPGADCVQWEVRYKKVDPCCVPRV